jgi:ubiquitin-protein ligase
MEPRYLARYQLTRSPQELAELMNDPPANISVQPNEANMSQWEVTIHGPVSTVFRPSVISAGDP